jgi:hypothetical protein
MTDTNVATTEAFAAFTSAAERANQQARAFGERATAAAREAGNLALNAYEQAVATYIELQHKAAEAAPVDSVKTAIETHLAFVKETTDAYLKAARLALRRPSGPQPGPRTVTVRGPAAFTGAPQRVHGRRARRG